ncbi:GntR family transcriptional regulator [Streptomyces sp. NRRL S-920]|uniref:GntR family transcriptional regulator n=1 Tax=Streptomyces sp. NRRL S-920 TaxID=1463921 RepID=UPI0004CA57D5|nr:GntR family transcriptional regulator [Streptomyces sp. NRRL S-920]
MATTARDIAAHYRRVVTDEQIRPGERLPTLRATCEQFGVANTTALRAYRMLEAEGLVSAEPRQGYVVLARPSVVTTGAQRVKRIQRGGPNYSHAETSRDHVAALRSCADPDICRELGVEPHSEILFRRRTFVQHGRPSTVAINVIAPRMWAAVPELLESARITGQTGGETWLDWYRQRTGRELTQGPEMAAARIASTDELAALEVDAPDGAAVPVLVLRSVWHDDEGPVMVWEDTLRPGVWHVTEGP